MFIYVYKSEFLQRKITKKIIFKNDKNGIQTIVFFNKETGSSTIIESFPDNTIMCIIASGDVEWAVPEQWQKTSLRGLTF